VTVKQQDSFTETNATSAKIDAGAPFEVDENPAEDDIFQLGRVHGILTDQTRRCATLAHLRA
jgi:hypothetical protein